jgi:phospholipase/carboxylesterase
MLQRKKLSLTYLEQNPKESKNAPLVLMLHGYGSNEKDLIQIAPVLPKKFRYISPRAPLEIDYGMFGWFPLQFTQNGIVVNYAEAALALQQLTCFMKEIVDEYKPAGNRLFLMGFSQGSVMSYMTAFNTPELLHGVIALSGQLPEKTLPTEHALPLLRKLPFLVMHGIYDDVLPIAKGRAAHQFLQEHVNDVIYEEYPIAHQISDIGISHIHSWLEERGS